jgi:hypothetical protein
MRVEVSGRVTLTGSGPYFAALFVIALVAFWPTYLSQVTSSTGYTHLQALTAAMWMVMLVAQPLAIREWATPPSRQSTARCCSLDICRIRRGVAAVPGFQSTPKKRPPSVGDCASASRSTAAGGTRSAARSHEPTSWRWWSACRGAASPSASSSRDGSPWSRPNVLFVNRTAHRVPPSSRQLWAAAPSGGLGQPTRSSPQR